MSHEYTVWERIIYIWPRDYEVKFISKLIFLKVMPNIVSLISRTTEVESSRWARNICLDYSYHFRIGKNYKTLGRSKMEGACVEYVNKGGKVGSPFPPSQNFVETPSRINSSQLQLSGCMDGFSLGSQLCKANMWQSLYLLLKTSVRVWGSLVEWAQGHAWSWVIFLVSYIWWTSRRNDTLGSFIGLQKYHEKSKEVWRWSRTSVYSWAHFSYTIVTNCTSGMRQSQISKNLKSV